MVGFTRKPTALWLWNVVVLCLCGLIISARLRMHVCVRHGQAWNQDCKLKTYLTHIQTYSPWISAKPHVFSMSTNCLICLNHPRKHRQAGLEMGCAALDGTTRASIEAYCEPIWAGGDGSWVGTLPPARPRAETSTPEPQNPGWGRLKGTKSFLEYLGRTVTGWTFGEERECEGK